MITSRWLLILGALLIAGFPALAQKAPRIGYVYPAGGQQGQTFDVTLGGQYLAGVEDVHFSTPGIEAAVLSHQRPLNGKETELLRDRLKTLQERVKASKSSASRSPVEAEEKEISEIQGKLALFANGRQFNTAIAENVTLRVTLAPDATLGDHEIRVGSPSGISNPLVFKVGQLPEFSEAAARSSLKAEIDTRPSRQPWNGPPKEAMRVTLPAVLNGQIMAGETDRFRFPARRGQRLLVEVSARKLIPYLPDAVPGWFQSTVALYDSQGRELAYADDFRFHPDPTFCYQLPADGEYEIEIRDSIYRGREDFVYRITAGELPFVTSVFPLGASAGTQANVELRGWNLPAPGMTLDLRSLKPGIIPLVATRGQAVSTSVPFIIDALPDVLEKEPNNVPLAANAVAIPRIVNGRIDQPGDVDVFSVQGKAGDEIIAEIHARRLGSPLDSVLRLTDVNGKSIASNDDHEDKGAGLTTHHADSQLHAKLPADGAYLLYVADAQRGGGADYSYRLRVGPPQPGFDLRVVPSSISGRAGEKVPVTVHALRREGFSGEISVSLKGPSKGFKLSGGVVPDGKDRVTLTLTLPVATDEPVTLELEGRAMILGCEMVRPAIPAEDMQQAFAYRHLVPAKELRIAVSGRLVSGGSAKIITATPLQIAPGGTARVQVAAAVGEKARRVQFELSDPPAGIVINNVSITPEGAEFDIEINAENVVVGEKGNLIVHAFHVSPAAKPGTKPRRIALGTLPSIPFEIVLRQPQ